MSLLTRTLLGSLAGACAALAALAALTLYQPAIVLDMDVDLPRAVTSGFYSVERTKDETFAWTSPLATITLRGIDRNVEWQCNVRLRGARPRDVAPAQVALGVDGATVTTRAVGDAYEDVGVAVPLSAGASSAALTISATPPYIPPSDPRELGVMLDEVRCSPASGWARASSAALTAAGIGGAVFGALFWLILGAVVDGAVGAKGAAAVDGARPLKGSGPYSDKPFVISWIGVAVGAILCTVVGLAVLLTTGVAGYSRGYLEWIAPVAILIGAGAATLLGVAVRRGSSLHPAARFVLAFSSAVLFLKILALLHPSKEVVDAIFQAHRLDAVLDGNYFFTQLMPGGVRFPYAIGLYVTAAPFAPLIADHVALLRIVVLLAEAVAAALLYPAIVRAWGDHLAAAAAVVLYHAAPLSYVIIGNANLTFAFGQSIAAIAVTLVVITDFERRSLLGGLGLFAAAALAYLSHVGVFPLVGLTLFATGLLYAIFGRHELRRSAYVVLGASVLAAIFAVGTYYAHFPEVWRSLGSVKAPAAAAPAPAESTPRTVAAPLGVGERTTRAGRIGVDAYGPWLLILVPFGLATMRRRSADRLTLALAGWGISLSVFLAFRVLAPVDAPFQRYADEFIHRIYGMTLPAVAVLTGAAFAWTWRQNAAWRVGGAAVMLAAVASGVSYWLMWFR